MKILIFGSRDWNNYKVILNVMNRLKAKYGDFVLIEGGCKGADLLAKKAAIECNIEYEEYPADWTLGKKAGPLRNQKMIDEGKPDMAVCFHNYIESSRGSKDMRSRLIKYNIPCYVIKGTFFDTL